MTRSELLDDLDGIVEVTVLGKPLIKVLLAVISLLSDADKIKLLEKLGVSIEEEGNDV